MMRNPLQRRMFMNPQQRRGMARMPQGILASGPRIMRLLRNKNLFACSLWYGSNRDFPAQRMCLFSRVM